jgi:hypothetical protein
MSKMEEKARGEEKKNTLTYDAEMSVLVDRAAVVDWELVGYSPSIE